MAKEYSAAGYDRQTVLRDFVNVECPSAKGTGKAWSQALKARMVEACNGAFNRADILARIASLNVPEAEAVVASAPVAEEVAEVIEPLPVAPEPELELAAEAQLEPEANEQQAES